MHTRLDNKRTERKPGSGRLNYVLKKCHNLHPSRHCAGQDCYSKQQHNICSLTYSYHKSRLHTQTRKIPQNRMGYFIQHIVLSTIRSRRIRVQQTEFIDTDNNYKLAKDHYIYLQRKNMYRARKKQQNKKDAWNYNPMSSELLFSVIIKARKTWCILFCFVFCLPEKYRLSRSSIIKG